MNIVNYFVHPEKKFPTSSSMSSTERPQRAALVFLPPPVSSTKSSKTLQGLARLSDDGANHVCEFPSCMRESSNVSLDNMTEHRKRGDLLQSNNMYDLRKFLNA